MDEAVAKTVVTIIAVATIATLVGVIAMITELPGITAEQRKVDRIVQLGLGLVIALLLVLGFVLASPTRAWSRDLDGRYAQSPLKPWFDKLKSGKGLCCSYADGVAIEDSDWDRTVDGKHYRVRIPDKLTPGDPMVWVDVPDDAVITEPNQAERTMVWPTYGIDGASIRCFMPGSMS